MKQFVPVNKGPVVIKEAASSNTISDAYKDSITIAYQFIDSVEADTSFTFCGRTLQSPIMAGPIGGQKKIMEDGQLHYARAIREAGSAYWTDYHDINAWDAMLAEGIPGLRVIKPLADLDEFIAEIRHDEQGGALAFASDIDHGLTVYGTKDGQQKPFAPRTAAELKQIVQASSLPFYLKGVMSVHDALAAAEAGAAGIVISGHNNRFPCAVPPLKILPAIRTAVGDRLQIFVDGGFNNGYDVFKALALGADGVLCARAFMAAFAKDGEDGLTNKILEMGAQLKGAMANTGSPDLKHINQDALILP